ncbi:hypothetical protein ACF0H5_004690 [Mactra antiquata]
MCLFTFESKYCVQDSYPHCSNKTLPRLIPLVFPALNADHICGTFIITHKPTTVKLRKLHSDSIADASIFNLSAQTLIEKKNLLKRKHWEYLLKVQISTNTCNKKSFKMK